MFGTAAKGVFDRVPAGTCRRSRGRRRERSVGRRPVSLHLHSGAAQTDAFASQLRLSSVLLASPLPLRHATFPISNCIASTTHINLSRLRMLIRNTRVFMQNIPAQTGPSEERGNLSVRLPSPLYIDPLSFAPISSNHILLHQSGSCAGAAALRDGEQRGQSGDIRGGKGGKPSLR